MISYSTPVFIVLVLGVYFAMAAYIAFLKRKE
jgi:hypothetical protein